MIFVMMMGMSGAWAGVLITSALAGSLLAQTTCFAAGYTLAALVAILVAASGVERGA